MSINIKLKRLHPDAKFPLQMTEGAANFDFTCTYIERNDDKLIYKFGWAVEFPPEYKLVIVPRSGLTHKGWIMNNSPGQVDADYRGELQIRLQAIPNKIDHDLDIFYPEIPYKIGDRVAQGYLEKVIPVTFEEVDELSETARGTGGFGSTGSK